MTNAEFTAWSAEYAVLFAMTRPEDRELIKAWWPSLYSFPVVDCHAAARAMAEKDPPVYRDKHLSRLLVQLRGIEAERRRRRLEEDSIGDDQVACEVCNGAGLVLVPHPRFILDGFWLRSGKGYVDVGVPCMCWRGQRRANDIEAYWNKKHPDRKHVTLTLRAYEMRYPHWRQMVEDKDNALRDERAAQDHAKKLDRAHGKLDLEGIKKRLAGGMGVSS